MSTTDGDSVKQYFCYQCNALVNITLSSSSSSDLFCPTCNGGFLEEYGETPNPNPQIPPPPPTAPFFSLSSSPSPPSSAAAAAAAAASGSSSSSDFNQFAPGFRFMFEDDRNRNEAFNPADLTAALFGLAGATSGGGGGVMNRSGYAEAEDYNPMMFLQNYLNSLRAGGANIQFVIENSGGGGGEGGFRLPANLGDYFVGPGLEQLIQQLAENDPNRYGTPPASKEAVEKLPDVKITDELLASDNAQCAVCMDTFELDVKAKQMPCNHIYHPDCILPWLELHNSCPVCRYELPTDDPDYEQDAAGGQRGNVNARATGRSVNLAATGPSGGSSEESPSGAQSGFRIQLPWPFNAFGSGTDGSNSDGGNPDNENSGGRSHQ